MNLFWLLFVGLAEPAGTSLARDVPTVPDWMQEEEPSEPSGGGGAEFSADQTSRLNELKAWLAARRLAREQGQGVAGVVQRMIPNTSVDVRLPKPPGFRDRQLLTPLGQRYSLGFQDRRNPPRPPYRPPYAQAESGARRPLPFLDDNGAPGFGTTPRAGSGAARWVPSQGSGTIVSGNRIVRIGSPRATGAATPLETDGVQPED